MKRLRVLLSAFAFSPERGSEPGIGWEVGTRLARYHDVTLLCGDVAGGRPTESVLARYFRTNRPVPGLTIRYIAPSCTAQIFNWLHNRPGFWPLYYGAYAIWQHQAFAVAQELHAGNRFDIAHQLTYGTYREPGHLWRLPVPFFWGPISGAANIPASFTKSFSLGGASKFRFRRAANWFQQRFSYRCCQAAQSARLVWVCTEAERALVQRWGGRSELQLDTGTVALVTRPRTRSEGEPLRLVWSGMHVERKAMPLALEAVAQLKGQAPVILHILGRGPETEKCRATAARLGVDSKVIWHGHVPHSEALSIMAEGHAFIHSSLLEAASTVVLEALSLGLPVVCHDTCGMAHAVTADCGIKIPLRNPETSISGFAQAIEAIANDSQLYDRLSLGAIERARELTWDRKVERFSGAYVAAATMTREEQKRQSA
jgi:glycosyltransferase involved in cell wall biosynthesis